MSATRSPAEAYAQARRDRQHPHLADFRGGYPFGLDPFQEEACRHVEDGSGVLVAAPTGAGKTVVGEFAVHLALARGQKAFYTTPIKALSNQKFHDLVERHGAENVGLLTGDNSINGEAPIVVMTTEVLRNMLYAGSRTLVGLAFVVMDEVHYLADRFRGAVWEEVIINLPESVSVVALSATVSNAEEFGDWLSEVRGANVTVMEERRPVPLHQHVLVGRRMFPLFEDDGTTVNKALERVAREDWQLSRIPRDRRAPKGGKRPHARRFHTPSRPDLVAKLDSEGLLPAIVFIFSRAGCDAAVRQCADARLNLTTPEEREEIRGYVDAAVAELSEDDLHVLGYHDFAESLMRGVAAHHAGVLPTFKECVEKLFSRGLVKVVFATETLALGINMPARSVVLEKLTKWNGETHADVTPGEYTQLTGRAGRRGIDVEGHGVVLFQPGLDPRQVAGLASTRTYPLKSSFKPSYNMAVNLVHQVGRGQARELLEQSFAQFQADRAVVGLARQIQKSEEALEGYAEAASCHLGDFMEYQGLRRRISELEARGAKRRKAMAREEVVESLLALRVGDVIDVPSGKFSGLAVVLDPPGRADRDEPRPLVLTESRHARRLGTPDFPVPVEPLTRMRVPRQFNARNAQQRRDLAHSLRMQADRADYQRTQQRPRPPRDRHDDPEIAELRRRMKDHPCHQCPDRESHARWAERHARLDRETSQQRRRIEQRTNTVAREFDRVCEVLEALGYLEGDTVTDEGQRLQRLYSESDLLISECLRQGLWNGLAPAELAAVLSGLTFSSRANEETPAPRFPSEGLRQVAVDMDRLAGELAMVEREHRLRFLRPPDFGFAHTAYRWASGAELDEVLYEADVAPGDFVRAVKQLIDLTAQVADAAGTGELRRTAREAVSLLRHGVVDTA